MAILNLHVPPLMRIALSVVMYPKDVVEWIHDANKGEKDPDHSRMRRALCGGSGGQGSRQPTQAADASATGSTAEEKPTPKKRLANEPEESKVTSAIH